MPSVEVVRPARLERATLCLEGRCSIQLSYGRIEQKITGPPGGRKVAVFRATLKNLLPPAILVLQK